MSTATISAPNVTIETPFLFGAEFRGITHTSSRWAVLEAFLASAEGVASRLIDAVNGFIVLVTVPGQKNSGAIYIYSEARRAFYTAEVPERDADISAGEFESIVAAYNLESLLAPESWMSRPRRARLHARSTRRRPMVTKDTSTNVVSMAEYRKG